MNGGAVKEDKSPENEAILVINVRDKCGWEVSGNRLRERDKEKDWNPRFKEGGPRSTLTCWDGLDVQKRTDDT